MPDASDTAYEQAWERFAAMMERDGGFNATRSLIAADPAAAVAMFQWMERQPPERREQLCHRFAGWAAKPPA